LRPLPKTLAALGSAILAALALGACRSAPEGRAPARRPYRDAALQTGDWLLDVRIPTPEGLVWPSDPRRPESVTTDLYAGTPGVVLFFVEAWRHTGADAYLEAGRRGADALVAGLPAGAAAPGIAGAPGESGLYVGLAGTGFTLAEVYRATGEARYLDAARRCVETLRTCAKEAGSGVEWNDCTDVIAGSAGIGLYLLGATRDLDDPSARELASRAGARLLDLAVPAGGGLEWWMTPDFPRRMPNFSHGTAGVAFFLAALHRETGDPRFLEGALAGARYLLSVADTADGGCRIFHDEPDGRDLYYLGWCHGPIGTARLFLLLHEITRDPSWMSWAERCARSVEASGIPEHLTDGFWNNVGQCCGSAGVIEGCLDLHQATGNARWLRFAGRVADDLLRRASPVGSGLKWVQTEFRRDPDLLVAQTGYMQGAAGIGIALLHLDARENGGPPPLRLPDHPFAFQERLR